MVGPVREQDRVAAGLLERRAEAVEDPLEAARGFVRRREPREVVVVRQKLACDHLAARGTPAEEKPDLLGLVAEPARGEERAQPETGEELRQLRRMPEAVG